MTDKNMALTILIDHFDEVGWPLNVYEDKLNKQASVVSTNDSESSMIVEIERHRPILGMTYTKGLGMEAFEEYFMRYAVDVSSSSVSELAERHGSYSFDLNGIVKNPLSFDYFDLSIESKDDNRYLVREGVSHDDAIVSTKEETVTFLSSLGESIEEQFIETVDRELGDQENQESVRDDLLSTYKQTLNAALLTKAEELWEKREDA